MIIVPATSFVHPKATLHGTSIFLGENCSVWPGAVIRADGGGSVTVGSNSNVQDGAIIHGGEPRFPVSIGNYVTVAHGAIIHGSELEDFVCIGIGAIVLDGCLVEKHVILGAGAVASPGAVLKSGWLYMGTPAKPVRELKPKEIAWLRENAELYVELCRENLVDAYGCVEQAPDFRRHDHIRPGWNHGRGPMGFSLGKER